MLKKSVFLILIIMLIIPGTYATIGDILNNVSSLEFDTGQGSMPDIIHISGDVYALAYRGAFSTTTRTKIQTIEINNDGTIDGPIATSTTSPSDAGASSIVHVKNDIYAAAIWENANQDCHLRIFNITSAGAISQIDTFEFDDDCGSYPVMVEVSDTIVGLIVRTGTDSHIGSEENIVYTFELNDDGTIKKTAGYNNWGYHFARLSPTNRAANGPSMGQVSGNVYVTAYDINNGNSYIETISINPITGAITQDLDSLILQSGNRVDAAGIYCDGGDICAITFHRTDDNDGWIKTFDIDSSGNIGSLKDEEEFDNAQGKSPEIHYLGSDIFAIAYQGVGNDGWLKTYEIDINGQISDTEKDFFEFDESSGYEPDIIKIAGDATNNAIIGIPYRGTGNDGFIKTFEIQTVLVLPNKATFSGSTTDFSAESDLARVSNMILANAFGNINWASTIYAGEEDYDSYVNIGDRFVSLDVSNLHSTINSSADITLTGFDCADFDLFYATGFFANAVALVNDPSAVLMANEANIGGDCIDNSICTNVACVGSTLTFTAQHFDGFGGNGSGGGGGGGVPEFSDYALILIITLVISGFFVIRKNIE